MSEKQDVYHHNDDRPRLSIKVEKNSKGFNWEISVSNCTSLDQAFDYLDNMDYEMRQRYETKETKPQGEN